MQAFMEFAQNYFWNVWMPIVFVIIVAWALWPSKARKAQMEDAAMIPFKDDVDGPKGGQNVR